MLPNGTGLDQKRSIASEATAGLQSNAANVEKPDGVIVERSEIAQAF